LKDAEKVGKAMQNALPESELLILRADNSGCTIS